jgi:hypothetical protein
VLRAANSLHSGLVNAQKLMARPKKPAVELQSIDECTQAMTELLLAQLDIEVLVAEANLAMAAAQVKFETRLDKARQTRADRELQLKTYYYTHLPEVEVGGVKHYQLPNGVIGRRDNPPALKPLNRSWSWDAITVRVRELWGKEYFHEPKAPEIDKDKLKTLSDEELKSAGLKVQTGETFYAEPMRMPEVEG